MTRRMSGVWRGVLAGSLFVMTMGAFANDAAAQERGRIVGRVTETGSGAPVGEVQVHIPGQAIGVLSRQDGRFVILNVPVGTHTLRAERIGLGTVDQQVTVTAGGTAEVNIEMETAALGLDEIVVTGTAGASRRREVGSTINQINTAELTERPADVTDLLTGAAPGVEVTVGGGGAGQGSKIRLRGSNSLEMGSDPIIYIDGVRMMSGHFPNQAAKDQGNRSANVTQSPLDMINPNDIERIEIIKGSAATTLYGTEASAGVIQVFTKRGSTGAPVWNAEIQQGTMWSQRFQVAGYDHRYDYGDGTQGPLQSSKYWFMDPWICTGFLKCGDRMGHTAWTQAYSASVRGGGENLQYFSSGEYFDELGNTPNDALEKWSVRGNFTYTPVADLQLQWNTAYTNQFQTNSPQGNNAEGLELNVFRQKANYFTNNNPDLIDRVFDWTLQSQIERFTTGGTATYSPMANLTNRLTIGYDFAAQESRNIRPFGFFAHPEGIVHNSTFQKRVLTFDYVGSYSFDVLSDVRSSFSWGGQAVGDDERQVEGYGRGFPGAAEPTVSSAALTQGYEEREKVWNAGFFLQNIFDISNRYFLTLGMRVDGNSAFGTGFGLQVYPKASASWVMSDEGFWNPGWGQIKLRAAYGQSGRAPGAFDAVRTWTNTALAGEAAFTPDNVGNADLGPEVTGEFEAGFDASWLDDRLRSTFTYYNQVTKDALLEVDQIPSLGFTEEQLLNVGEITNVGIEASLEVSAIRSADWGWDLGLNVSTNESEIQGHPLPENNGRALDWDYHILIRNPDAIPATRGVIPYCDASDVAASDPCRERNVYRGSNLPTTFLNGFTTVRLPRGISLALRGEYRGGHYVTSITTSSIGRSVRFPACFPYYENNEDVTLKPQTNALWQARCTPGLQSGGGGWSMKADYFKMRSLTATLPMDFAFPDRIQNATLTLALNNFWTWSRESPFGTFAIENFTNDGGTEEQSGISANERIPAPTTFRASLRVTF